MHQTEHSQDLGTVTFNIFTSWYGLSVLSVFTFSIPCDRRHGQSPSKFIFLSSNKERMRKFIAQLKVKHTCTTSMPFTTLPKTVCLLSSHGVATVVMKNWEPLVQGPALAIETVKGLSCLKLQERNEMSGNC